MTAGIRIIESTKRLGKREWDSPRAFGPEGWVLDRVDGTARIIATVGPAPESDRNWLHASISRPDQMPTYDDLVALHKAFWPDGWAYQVFAPPSAHVNIHPYALHLWGLPDGAPLLPNFGAQGSI